MNEDEEDPQGSLADEYGIGGSADTPVVDPLAQEAPEEPEAPEAPEAEAEAPEAGVGEDGFAPLLEALRGQGISSFSDLEAQMMARQGADQLAQETAAIAQEIQARVDAGQLDEETAQELYNARVTALELSAQVAQEQQKLQAAAQREAEAALAKLSPDLAKAAREAKLTVEQLKALTPILEKAVGAREKKSVAQYVAQKGQGADASPIPEAGGGSPRDAAIDVDKVGYSDLFAMDGRKR